MYVSLTFVCAAAPSANIGRLNEQHHVALADKPQQHDSRRARTHRMLIFKGLIPRKNPVTIGRFAEQNLQDKESYAYFPTCAEREKEKERKSNGWVLRGTFSSCSRGLTHAALPANHPPPE
mmetsp:Transcript_1868/g.2557  ORF Transcript_1868/g.2557 Transcript_1868/m.2557 type:complete len:121 (-) Transcript_1868:440-802(-)